MNDDQLYAMRHSLAHITAQAVQHLWPQAKFGVGPVVENGFYYDIDLDSTKLSETDFPKIEAEMRSIVAKNFTFERTEKLVDEAIAWAQQNSQPYKEELLNDLKRAGTTVAKDLDSAELGLASEGEGVVKNVSFYTDGDFTDLCRGPHAATTGSVGAFKLMRVAGAYWRGKESNAQMQRLYGVAFQDQKALDEYLTMLEEAKKRDHRKLGQELDLFTFSELVGQGLPLWTPRGTILRTELDRYVQEMRDEAGFQAVSIPHITKKDLYEKSGHWAKFADELFRITTREGHEFAMKPMNCPHHTQIYDAQPRSYRDLPIRYRETTMVYRDEQTGELGGLSRVRGITQDDAHIFCRYTHVEQEVLMLWDIIERFYSTVGMTLRLRLSLHDPANRTAYLGTDQQWSDVEETLRKIARHKVGDDFVEALGDAAFYGPKFDFLGRDALGREHQVATIQFDFNQPEGFDLNCTNENGDAERIVMVHCATMGSLERFLSVYIEHSAGKFPLWLAPEQLRIIQVKDSEEVVAFVNDLKQQAKASGIRAIVDDSNESVGKKIRAAELWKVPYTLVIGEKEVADGRLAPRVRTDLAVLGDVERTYSVEQFIGSLSNEVKARASKSSL